MNIGAPKKNQSKQVANTSSLLNWNKRKWKTKTVQRNHKVLGTKKSGFKLPNSFSALYLLCSVVSSKSFT